MPSGVVRSPQGARRSTEHGVHGISCAVLFTVAGAALADLLDEHGDVDDPERVAAAAAELVRTRPGLAPTRWPDLAGGRRGSHVDAGASWGRVLKGGPRSVRMRIVRNSLTRGHCVTTRTAQMQGHGLGPGARRATITCPSKGPLLMSTLTPVSGAGLFTPAEVGDLVIRPFGKLPVAALVGTYVPTTQATYRLPVASENP